MGLYPPRAVERAMKVQEVILRAIGGEINWIQAAEIIGVSPRTMRRWRQRYQEYGYDGLFDRRLKRPSPKRVPLETVQKVLRLYREKYFDFNVAHSPQARGRCERMFGTWQGRLPQELRLRGISTMAAANRFLRQEWIGFANDRFTLEPAQAGTAFVPTDGADLEKIFSRQETRVVRADNTVSFKRRILQVEPQKFRYSLAKCRVLVCEHLDGSMSLYYGPHRLGRYDRQGQLLRGQQTEAA